MSNEEKRDVENVCLCKSECFRKFIMVILASFIGCFCALCLFFALHKPCFPMAPMQFGPQIPPQMAPQMAPNMMPPQGNFGPNHHFYKIEKKVFKQKVSPEHNLDD